MIINVTDEWRIESDFRSWGIAKRETNGKWRQINWLDSLPSAIIRMAELLARMDPLVTDSLSEALDRAEAIAEQVRKSAVKPKARSGWKGSALAEKSINEILDCSRWLNDEEEERVCEALREAREVLRDVSCMRPISAMHNASHLLKKWDEHG
jgi:hypothetical protein